MAHISEDLDDWSTIKGRHEWPTLLMGNGFSVNIWPDFAYTSLFDRATLTPMSEALFRDLDTANFELVLECLHHARLTAMVLRQSQSKIDRLYDEVRDALFKAISDAHVRWNNFPQATHDQIAKEVDRYRSVFTTNYDLNLYWSLLQGQPRPNVVDFFWGRGNSFDPDDVSVRSSNATRVHFLHGGLHLWQDDTGVSGKWTNASGGSLLHVASNYSAASQKRPLFVSEGDSKNKVRTIRRSEYLTYCHDALEADAANTVVLGQSLSKQDEHIIQALNDSPHRRRIAVSIYPGLGPHQIVAEKGRIRAALPRHRVSFFDSTTHPLGDPALRVP